MQPGKNHRKSGRNQANCSCNGTEPESRLGANGRLEAEY